MNKVAGRTAGSGSVSGLVPPAKGIRITLV